jgi:hypothetical protein
MSESPTEDDGSVDGPHRMGCLGWSIFGILLAILTTGIIVLDPLGQDEGCCFPVNEMNEWKPDHPPRSAAFYDNAANALERYLVAHGWVKTHEPAKGGLVLHFRMRTPKDLWYQKPDQTRIWVRIQQSYARVIKAVRIEADGSRVPEEIPQPDEMSVGIAWQAPHGEFNERQLKAAANKLDQELRQWWKDYVATHSDKEAPVKLTAEETKRSTKQLTPK